MAENKRIVTMRGVEQPVTIRGITYPSQCVAALDLGVSQSCISMAIARGRIDQVGLTKNGSISKAKSITIRGITYTSHKVAAAALGVTRSCISQAARRGTLATVGLQKLTN